MARANPTADFIGRRFTRLVVVQFAGYKGVSSRARRPQFRCLCDCGIEVVRGYQSLHSGASKSCGCLTRELRTTHGGTKTPVYQVWHAMHSRCENPKDPGYKNYGARGITVCQRWSDFAAFRDDMGRRPPGGTLERNDVNGHYEPGNCRWATQREQANNKRTNRVLTLNGESRTIADWARLIGVAHSRIWYRIEHGWSVEEALTKGWSRGERRDLTRQA